MGLSLSQIGSIMWPGRQYLRLPSYIVLIAQLMVSTPALATDIDALIKHIDHLWRGETSRAEMEMQVKTQRYQRTMTMETWSRGKEYSLVRIRNPVKDRGIATLKVEANIWNYLPKINRVTKIPSSMMSGSWMGSHFTNDDLIKESTFAEDYQSAISFEGERNGQMLYEITSIPNVDAAVVWGKVIMQIEQHTLAPLQALYYDEEEVLIRTLTFDQQRTLDDRVIPMRLTLQPTDKPNESTVIIYRNIRFGVPLDSTFFSLKNLQRLR